MSPVLNIDPGTTDTTKLRSPLMAFSLAHNSCQVKIIDNGLAIFTGTGNLIISQSLSLLSVIHLPKLSSN